MSKYPYSGASASEHTRLLAMQEAYDPVTICQLEARGIAEGWRCLEVGAGAGSIALWLCKRVGNTGQVIATDTNTESLTYLNEPNLEILHHDITVDELPQNQFDLVHARFLLDLLPQRDVALDRMVGALKPQGWIILEEFDSITSVPDPSIGDNHVALFLKIQNAMRRLWAQNGFDAEYGRKLMRQLLSRGLDELGAEGHLFMRQGGTPGVRPWYLSVEQLRERFISFGFTTEDEIKDHQAMLDNPKLLFFSPLRVIAWGRRPLR
jgi:ubiquinone/menaquinone biosynthesis C-methylase UbiE